TASRPLTPARYRALTPARSRPLTPARYRALTPARSRPLTPASWTRGTTNRLEPIAGTIWSGSFLRRERRSLAGAPARALRWYRWGPGSGAPRGLGPVPAPPG